MKGSILLVVILLILVGILILLNNSKIRRPLPVEMRPSPVHGRGIFACEFIPKDTVIETAPLITFNRQELSPDSKIRLYDIAYKDGASAVMLGYASIYNHSDSNNAYWYFDENDEIIYIKSNKDIHPDEEVFVNYGPNYWKSKNNKV